VQAADADAAAAAYAPTTTVVNADAERTLLRVKHKLEGVEAGGFRREGGREG
jgi:hypothetical protein